MSISFPSGRLRCARTARIERRSAPNGPRRHVVSRPDLWHNHHEMRTLVVPYGEAGWKERLRVLDEVLWSPSDILTGREGSTRHPPAGSRQAPPFLFGDILVLVPSARIRRTYGRLFLDLVEHKHGARGLSQPDVQTLSQFLQRVAARTLEARLIDESARLVLLEGLVKERIAGSAAFGRSPDLLAPSLSAAVADMIEELSLGGVHPDRLAAVAAEPDLSEKPQVRLLVDVYERYEAALRERGLVDPAGMQRALHERFDPAWLSQYRTVIIDGIHDAAPHAAGILRRVAEQENCVVIIDAPSPDAVRNAGTSHPLRLLREFLAVIGSASAEAAAVPDADDRFLAEALFSERSFEEAAGPAPSPSVFRKDLRLCSAVNAREEVSFIAREVRDSIGRGTPPDSILAAFPSLDEYGPLVEEIFSDYGIPYNRALGRQLSTSPVATALVALLQTVQEDFSGPSLQRVVSSPFLKFAEQPAVAPSLDRFLRDHGIAGGKERILSSLKRLPSPDGGPDVLAGPLSDLFAALEPFASRQPAPLSAWMDHLAGLVTWSGLGGRAALIKGPLSTNLQAFRKLMDTLTSLHAAGRLFPGYQYTFSEWFFLVKKTLMHARFQVPPDDEGGVQVLGMEESAGHAWNEIYLGGLVDGSFPQRLPQNIFLPEATLEALGVRTLEHARIAASFHFYRLLQSAQKVVLTRPENVGEQPMVPSPFLEELAPLRHARLLKESGGLQFSFRIDDCRSVPELAKALALTGEVEGLDQLLAADLPGLAGIRAAAAYRSRAGSPLPAPEALRTFRVTELDAYLRCPYDYYVANVLEIAPLEEVTEDLSPLDRGSKVHSILRNFYLSWDRQITADDRGEAAALLRQLAESAFSVDADTFRNRREKDLFMAVMAERFLDAELLFWKQGMRPSYLEQKIEGFRLSLSDGTEVELTAKIDRIDVDRDGNFIIVDYKTGQYPQPRNGVDQEIFQLPVYAVMARSLAGQGPMLKRAVGLAYYDLAGRVGRTARDVVLYDRDSIADQSATKPQSSAKSAADFEQVLAASMDKARRAIEGILRGEYPMTPKEENRCRYCSNEMMCKQEP